MDLDLGLSTHELELRSRARAFAADIVRPRAAAIDRDEQYPWDIVKALSQSGFCGMTIPESLGGQGRSFLDAVLVIEEMAKACTVTGRIIVETNMGAISTVMAYGSEAQKRLAADLVITGGGVSRLHLIFARVFDERGEDLGIGGFLAVRDEAKGLRVVRREATMGL